MGGVCSNGSTQSVEEFTVVFEFLFSPLGFAFFPLGEEKCDCSNGKTRRRGYDCDEDRSVHYEEA